MATLRPRKRPITRNNALTSSNRVGKRKKAPARVFISYAHMDEKYKKELVAMLAGLENQKIIKVWHDGQISPGAEWHEEIKKAMKNCRMALLLVSQYFLASPFIRDEELPTLLTRRIEAGMIVIPIIIRPCPWSGDTLLGRLQALPANGRPVANVTNRNRRDQIWADIAEAIGKRIT
jgi:hypothetical protein